MKTICVLLPLLTITVFAQNNSGRFSYYSVSSNDLNDSIEVYLTFQTTKESLFKDSINCRFISYFDTIFTSTTTGFLSLKLTPADWKIELSSKLVDTLYSPFIHFNNYRKYYFDISIETKTFVLPEIRYDLGKPVVYFFTDKEIDSVKLKLTTDGSIYFSYPEYHDGWNFSIKPPGVIKINDKTFPYLFWEAEFRNISKQINFNDGFTVETSYLINFFDSLLNALNFPSSMISDFITYWCPKMMQFEVVDIRFLINNNCNALANYTIVPPPNNFYRIYMIWKPSNGNELMQHESIPLFEVNGYTALEWGGMLVLE